MYSQSIHLLSPGKSLIVKSSTVTEACEEKSHSKAEAGDQGNRRFNLVPRVFHLLWDTEVTETDESPTLKTV